MAVLTVVRYPDRVLKTPAAHVGEVGDRERALAVDLVETMHAAPSTVGLAAPQVGVSVAAFVLDVSRMRTPQPNHGLVVMFDPELVESEAGAIGREGCLSLPDYTCDVRRSTAVVVRGLTPDGNIREVEASGFEARAFQHELDHLTGLLILDRVTSLRTDVFRRKRYATPGEPLR